jgi:lipopolysaccharide/colanic/teichoic acid biosynthesis glycosyltransferase
MSTRTSYTPFKRFFDIVLSAAGLLLVSPLLAVLAIIVKLDSPGPVFYRGLRAGRFGMPFRIFKLRTMVADAEQRGGSETPNDDPRITRVGSILRQTKLDEFPQLINVFLGDMSLVGPRPEVLEEVCNYTTEERELLNVRPGITDWASIRFRHEGEILRGSADPHLTYHVAIRPEKIRLGLEYVHHQTLWTDCVILARTLQRLFSRVKHADSYL